jgi:hypothetical protein
MCGVGQSNLRALMILAVPAVTSNDVQFIWSECTFVSVRMISFLWRHEKCVLMQVYTLSRSGSIQPRILPSSLRLSRNTLQLHGRYSKSQL